MSDTPDLAEGPFTPTPEQLALRSTNRPPAPRRVQQLWDGLPTAPQTAGWVQVRFIGDNGLVTRDVAVWWQPVAGPEAPGYYEARTLDGSQSFTPLQIVQMPGPPQYRGRLVTAP